MDLVNTDPNRVAEDVDDEADKDTKQSLTRLQPDWAQEPSQSLLREDLNAAKPSRDLHVQRVNRWNNLLLVKGEAQPKKKPGRSAVQPKLIRRQAEWRYPALTEPFLGSDKLIEIRPRTFEDRPAANQNELLLNWQFKTKTDLVKFIDDFVRANVDEGSAIVRTGWYRTTEKRLIATPVYDLQVVTDQAQLDMLQQAMELRANNPREFNETVDPAIQESLKYYDETGETVWAVKVREDMVMTPHVVENYPTATVLNPANVFIDPSCQGDMDKAKFAVISFETSEADLKAAGIYKNLESVQWDQATLATEVDHTSSTPVDFNFSDKLRKRIVAYEYWGYHDIHGNGALTAIVATWVGDTMIRMEENPYPDKKIPLVISNYLPVKRELLGEPDAELLGDNQAILGAMMRGMIDLMGRSANGQQGFAKGMLDALNKRRFDSGQDYEFNGNMPVGQGHIQHTYPEIPQSAMLMVSMQNQEAEALTGVKAYAGGVSGESYGQVAAGIKGVLDAASKREMSILRRLAAAIMKIAMKFVSMNAVFLTEEEVVRVTNEQFVTIKREDLRGNFDLIVDISTAEIDNAKAQDLGFMLQTMGNNLDFGMVKLILVEIAKLKRMPDLAKMIEKFEPQPDPMEQRLKELEIAEKEAIIAKLQSETVRNNSLAVKAEAEANSTQLDTIEQETGTKHARDIDKMKAQSDGNASLEITKHLLAPTKEGERAAKPDAAIGWNALGHMQREAQTAPRLSLNSQQNGAPAQPPLSL